MMKRKWLFIIVGLLVAGVVVYCFCRFQHRTPQIPLPEFRPTITDRGFYDAAFADNASLPIQAGIEGILVSHHLLAAPLIAESLVMAATEKPLTVLIISPDHFYRGAAPITTVAAQWWTPYGILQPDVRAVSVLSDSVFIDAQAWPFTLEHGIFAITPFVARTLSHARIVPLIVKDTAPQVAIDAAVAQIGKLSEPLLIIGSFDFTHDSTMAQAESNDRRSVPIVSALDTSRIGQVAVDSHAGLAVFLGALKARSITHFSLIKSTNSARLTGRYDQTDVTSYIIGTFTR